MTRVHNENVTEVEEIVEEVAEVEETDGTEEAGIPLWMSEEETDLDSSEEDDDEVEGKGEGVPVATLVSIKKKLKGKISDRDTEIEDLKRQLAAKSQTSEAPQNLAAPKRPRISDFGTDDEYEDALDQYEEQKLAFQTQYVQHNSSQNEKMQKRQQELSQAVESHYDRAAKLVQNHSISPEVFKQTDMQVRAVIEDVFPKRGEPVFNDLIYYIGEDSEKVLFHIGRNKSKLAEFESLLRRDPTGLKAVAYLNRIAGQVSNTKTHSSRAPKPAAQINGDAPSSAKESALKKKWDAAHKKGNADEARRFKKQARINGIDVNNWR